MPEFGKRIFVFGATGYTGREVVRSACERNLDAIAHVRPDSPRLADWRQRFGEIGARVDTTPWTTDELAETLRREKPTTIVIAIGTTRDRAKRVAKTGGDAGNQSYDAVDFGLTKKVVDATLAARIGTRVVYLSAIGANTRSTSGYGRARWRAEETVRSSGLPYTIVRPAFISGDGRDEDRVGERVAAKFFDVATDLAGAVGFERLRRRWRTITGAQLGDALVRIFLDPDCVNRVVESEELVEKLVKTL